VLFGFKVSGILCAGVMAAVLASGCEARAATAGDPVKGKEVFRDLCSICHNAERGAGIKVGPNLFGIVGRKSATEPAFFYSPAMKQANLTWNEVTLRAFLAAPHKIVPGTTMGFLTIVDRDDETNLMAYLHTLK
jgi:cytochrome c